MTEVDRRDRDAARAAGEVLGASFTDDPVWRWLLRGRARERRLQAVFCAVAAEALAVGGRVLVTAERSAAAVWLPPSGPAPGPVDALRAAPGLLRGLRAGVVRGARLHAVLERHRPGPPHWYLQVLGTVPAARGTGVGRRLVEPVLAQCDAGGRTAYLESSNPRNWPFYERLGFVRGAPLPVPPGCPLMVPMTRAPG